MRTKILIVIPLILVGIDQGLKWISRHLIPAEGMFLVPGLLGLEPYQNPGIAFGIPVPHIILTAGSLALALGFGYWGLRNQRLSALLVAAGGISNSIDRILFSVTFDYIRIGPLSLINLADTLIAIGLVLLVLQHKKSKNIN